MVFRRAAAQKQSFSREKDGFEPKKPSFSRENQKKPSFGGPSPIVLEKMVFLVFLVFCIILVCWFLLVSCFVAFCLDLARTRLPSAVGPLGGGEHIYIYIYIVLYNCICMDVIYIYIYIFIYIYIYIHAQVYVYIYICYVNMDTYAYSCLHLQKQKGPELSPRLQQTFLLSAACLYLICLSLTFERYIRPKSPNLTRLLHRS